MIRRRVHDLALGGAIGITAGAVGILIALGGPVVAGAAVFGALAALYMLTNINAALYAIIAVLSLLPFGTFPFDILITPTLLDGAIGAFLLVYLLQWMRGHRRGFRLTPVHLLLLLYTAWLIFSFVFGLRFGSLTATIARQFAGTLLSIGMVFILVDLLREPAMLRRLLLLMFIGVGIQAVLAIVLYAMPDATAERTLIRLARVGYPNGGVIRYVEDDPLDNERAIGTFIDPNVLGGFLAILASMIAPQVFARRPVIRWRWLALTVLSIVIVALILTFSRAAMIGFAAGIAFIGLFRGYRRFHLLLIIGLLLLLVLPQTRAYIDRFAQGLAGQDLATQMRLGEYGDALELISRFPLTGIGFTGTPEADLYTDVASMYLIMANQIGLTGVLLFLATMAGVFIYGLAAWRHIRSVEPLTGPFLGFHAALVTVLLNSLADLYYFRLDFQPSITLLWLVVALCLSTSRTGMDLKPASDGGAGQS
ncbi:MAG: O-antigen ligase family protein [Anaerolinea sp.]|nr:O-antigen ligase family protein [Anaerolinea sp.]